MGIHGWQGIATLAGTLVMAASVGGCLRDNPNHCANSGGDAKCADRFGTGSFCSRCTSEREGCVTERPTDACHVVGDSAADDESAGDETMSSSVGEASGSETGDVDCTREGLDASCPETAPYCVDGACASCVAAGGGSFCQSLDPLEPICLGAAGLCVACLPDQLDACPHTDPFCDQTFSCSGCTEHADCPDSACDIERGLCFATSRVFWVSNDATCPGSGTQAAPFCEIKSALDEIRAPTGAMDELQTQGVIKLVRTPTPYSEMVALSTAADKRIAFIGVGPTAPMIRDVARAMTIGNHRVYISNLSLSHNLEYGLRTHNHGRIWVDDTTFTGNPLGVAVDTNSRMRMRRVRVVGNDAGVAVLGNARLHMATSVIGNNGEEGAGSIALRVEGARFDVVYTTIANNRGAAIQCGELAAASSVRNSIVAGPDLAGIDCAEASFSYSFVDTPLDGEGIVVTDVYDSAWFANAASGIFRPVSGNPFRDVARWGLGDPLHDLAGVVRAWVPGPDVAGALLP